MTNEAIRQMGDDELQAAILDNDDTIGCFSDDDDSAEFAALLAVRALLQLAAI